MGSVQWTQTRGISGGLTLTPAAPLTFSGSYLRSKQACLHVLARRPRPCPWTWPRFPEPLLRAESFSPPTTGVFATGTVELQRLPRWHSGWVVSAGRGPATPACSVPGAFRKALSCVCAAALGVEGQRRQSSLLTASFLDVSCRSIPAGDGFRHQPLLPKANLSPRSAPGSPHPALPSPSAEARLQALAACVHSGSLGR